MSTLDPTVVPRALVLLLSSLLTMLVTPFNNSTVMIGKVVLLRFVKIVSLALDPDLADAVASADVEALEVALADVEDLEVVADLAVALEVVEALVAADSEVELHLASMLELLLDHPIPSPTMLLLVPTEARSSMSAM